MKFHPFEVTIPHIIYAALGGFVVFFGMFSLFIRERLYIGEACWAFLFGVVIGPHGANIFNPRGWGNGDQHVSNEITLEITRVVLAIGVFAIGVELPKAYMAKHWRSLLILLGPVMTWGWFVSAGLIYALIPGLNFLSSLAIAACLTPTDPILAAAVVGGKYADKHVPAHIRHLLAAESGCNDGAAYPFLFLALYLTIDSSTGKAISDWFLLLWLYQVILGIVLGAIIGFGFRHLMKFCERKDFIDRQSYVAQYVSLSMLTIGVTTLLGSDDLLAAFACGTTFAWDGFFNKQTEQAVFSSVIDLLFNVASFVFVGAWMPFEQFNDKALSLSVWRLIVIGVCILLVRRLPVIIALYKWIPDVKTFREAVFSGHFGPIGIGAIFISTLAAQQLPHPHDPPQGQNEILAASIQPIVAFMVLCSIAVHGLSIPFFSLGRTVSRTWSRHDTWGRGPSLPEWANQTRTVTRPEDIVINRDRDPDPERGVTGSDEKVDPESQRSKGDSLTPTAHGEGSSDGEEKSSLGTVSSQARGQGAEGARDIREEVPPDGEEIVAEWREGPDSVIERRAGPGEEVEVEVRENTRAPHKPRSKTQVVAEGTTNDTVNQIRQPLSQIGGDVGRVEEHAQVVVKREVSEAKRQAAKLRATLEKHLGPKKQSKPRGGDDDEEWLSDQSNGEGDAGSSNGPKSSHKPRSPKLSTSHPVGSGRRRHSFRRGVLSGRPIVPTRTPSSDSIEPIVPDNESDDESRGRRRSLRDATFTKGSMRSLRHHRISSIIAPGSRELSPARSVRWADTSEPARPTSSGMATPHGILSPSSPPTPLPGSEAPSDDEGETPSLSQTQVKFAPGTAPGHS